MEEFNISFPISFVKKEERIVVGIATADNIDKSGDIVDFNASVEAFKDWAGNIREMHSPVAVGKAIKYEPVKIKSDDGNEYNAIKVEAYISKGAQDTWEKVLDGTLRAFSIGGSIVEKSSDASRMFRGRPVNIIKKYRLGELSLVDNPANALAVVDVIKMDNQGNLEYALDELLDKAKKQPLKDPKGGLTAAGRRHFKQTEGANLKPGVRGPANTPEKMRRKGSFLTRFFTNPSGPMKDEKGRPTRLALSAAAWGEPVPQNAQDAAALAAKGRRLLERYAKIKNKSVDDIELDNDVLIKMMESFIGENAISKANAVNVPNNPKLYAQVKAEAKKKFKVYPSLYANAWLVREYKKRGGTYRMSKEGEVTAGGMNAGIKNPTQGYGVPPQVMKPKKKKKEKPMKKAEDASNLVDALNDVLSNAVVLYFSAHRAHWNVEGPDFSEYHDLFGEIYNDVYGSIDPFAEDIRKLGGYPQTLSNFEDGADFSDDSATTDAKALALNLYMKNAAYIDMLKTTFDMADSSNEQGIANFIADRINAHQKWAWQLSSSLKSSGVDIPVMDESEEEDESDDMEEEDKPTTMEDLMAFLEEAMNMFEENSDDEITKNDNEESENNVEYNEDQVFENIEDMFDALNELIENELIEKAGNTKKENGIDFPASAFAYVPDPDTPSTWKLRLWEDLETKVTAAQVGRAIAAIGKGFRGNVVDIPESDMATVKSKIRRAWKSTHPDAETSEMPEVLKLDITDNLQNDNNYDTVNIMDSSIENKLSLMKRFVNWLSSNNIEQASTNTKVEVINDSQEDEEMDIEILKGALSEVVDQKLADLGTSIKEDVEASVQSKIDDLTKSFEADKAALQEKLEATEKALAEQEEQVKAFAKSGAVKKSVDTIDEEEELVKSEVRSESFWHNAYLPQGLIDALGYQS